MSIQSPARPAQPAQSAQSAQSARPPSVVERAVLGRRPELLATIGLFLITFGQATGRIVVDTKLDLAINPGGFLAAASHLWDPNEFFGSVQNQAYGYLFPMGPYYWLCHTLGVPAWIVQRSWLGLLFAGAMWGTILLAEELGIGGTWSRLAGGVSYALAPTMLTATLASAGLLPAVMLPWVLLPLVRAAHGKTTITGAALRSGAAILLMGGVNATSVFGVLPLPLIWFATRRASPARTRLFWYWVLGVVLASSWFLLGLVFQGKYGFNFIPYTESAADTTKLASIPETLRGAGVWLSLVTINGVWTPAGYIFETLPATIIATAAVAGAGLYGLVRRDMPERLFLVLTVALSTLAICSGYWGHLGGPFANVVHILFFGPLAALRNVYKFQPMVALALALGLVHSVDVWGTAVVRAFTRYRSLALGGFVGALTLAMAVAALPALNGNLYPVGSFSAMPSYWTQATKWLNARGALSTTLVIPGAAFGRFTWGTTNDQPIEPLADEPWADRDIAPLGSVGNTQFLDEVDQVLVNGQPVIGFGTFLASAGVRYLLVENDLDTTETDSPPPVVVRTVLAGESGIPRVATFGPIVTDTDSGPESEIDFDPGGTTAHLHALDVYQVLSTGTGNSMVTTYPADKGVVLSGGPQGAETLAQTGELGNVAVGLAGDPLAPKFTDPTWVDADTQQLRDTDFGQLYQDVSYVLQPNEPAPNVGGKPQEWKVVTGVQHETYAELHGAARISASSYGTPVTRIPGYQPLSAFINDPETAAWVASGTNLHDPWIQITFTRPITVRQISVTPVRDGPWRPIIKQVRVSTTEGSVTSDVAPLAVPQTVPAAPGRTTFVRVTITRIQAATEPAADAGPGFLHVGIPGVTVSESLKLPDDGVSGPTTTPTYLFNSVPPNEWAYLSPPDTEPHMSRVFTVPKTGTFRFTGSITPRPSPLLMGLFDGNSPLQIRATSTFGNLPLYRPQNVLDTSIYTSWWAGAGTTDPQLTYTWPTVKALSTLLYEPDVASSAPTQVRLSTPYQSELVTLPAAGGRVHFPTLSTDKLSVVFTKVKERSGYNILTKSNTDLPIGLAQLSFPVLTAAYPITPVNTQTTYGLACGSGPQIDIDGHAYQTAVIGKYLQVIGLQPMYLTLCTPTHKVTLTAGTHTLTVQDQTIGMKVTRIALLGTPIPDSPPPRTVKIVSWGSSHRTVSVTAGPGAIVGVHQNYSPGWIATVDGKRLQPVRLFGWQQGYELPASTHAQTITLTFTPTGPFRTALLVGGLLALVLVVWACIPNRRRRAARLAARSRRLSRRMGGSGGGGGWRGNGHRRPAPSKGVWIADEQAVGARGGGGAGQRDGAHGPSVLVPVGTSAGPVASSGYVAPAAASGGTRAAPGDLDARHGYAERPWVAGLMLTGGLFLLAGPVAAAVPLLVSLPRIDRPRRQRFRILGSDRSLVVSPARPAVSLPLLALGGEVLAGLITAVRPGLTYNAVFGPLSYTAQFLGGIALGALVISLVPDLPRWQRAGGDSAPPAWEPSDVTRRRAVGAGNGRDDAVGLGSGGTTVTNTPTTPILPPALEHIPPVLPSPGLGDLPPPVPPASGTPPPITADPSAGEPGRGLPTRHPGPPNSQW